MYQKATITYTDPDVAKRWEKIWISWCKCQCLRVAPATYTKEQHDSRFQYTAVLRNIPFRLDGMDLINILQDSGAASLGLPRNRVSYGNKPWCYFFFKSQEALDSAIEMNFTLKNRKLVWCSEADIKTLCPRCSSPNHAAKDCDAFNNRGRSSTPRSLLNNYERFKPAGYKNLGRNSNYGRNDNRNRPSSRSRSRSKNRNNNSNNTTLQSSNKNINNNNSSNSSSSTGFPSSRPNKNGQNVSYARITSNQSGLSLDNSIHAPSYKGKGKETASATPPPALIDTMVALVRELTLQLSEIRKDYMALKTEITKQNSQISNIEHHLSGSNTPTETPMEISPNTSSSSSIPPVLTSPEGSQVSPNNSDNTQVDYNDKLDRIDSRYNSMESMLHNVVNMLSGFTSFNNDTHTRHE